jgi:hypothetical protein
MLGFLLTISALTTPYKQQANAQTITGTNGGTGGAGATNVDGGNDGAGIHRIGVPGPGLTV